MREICLGIWYILFCLNVIMTCPTFGTMALLVGEGDVTTLREYLENRYVSPNIRDENGQTLLMLAAQYGRAEIARELINQGCDVNAEDYDEWSALLNAAREGHIQIVSDLLSHGAKVEHRDMGGWSPLMWACYRGHTDIVRFLLQQGGCPNVHDAYHISCLVWAAGRGFLDIVKNLLCHGANVNSGDKYGTTPLVWSARKGHTEIVDALLHSGANVDTAGMYSWTPLIVAVKGNFPDVVNLLLQYKPNVNAMDKDGCTPLTIACKEGYVDIAMELLNVGAYINLQDKNGDTNLILASRAGHYTIVDALLKKYVDVDIQGEDGKTAIYWAVEKNHADIVRILLTANPNLEIATKDGDTPLLKATRNRNTEIVQLLVDKKAKVSAADKKGDTALHVAMRARSKGIIEILLRNPKNSQLLYRPNRAAETPYNIDISHQKSILAQIFGARRLNTNEDSENMLGYDLYSSALADILSEPSLSMPISVGLYAKWGSGKSFLLNKLEEEMRNFAVRWLEPTFEFSWLVFIVILLSNVTAGLVLMVATGFWITFLCITLFLFFCEYAALGVVLYGTQRYDWLWAYRLSVSLAQQLSALKTFMQVIFCNPPASRKDFTSLPVKFLFTDRTKVSSSVGDLSVLQVVVSLCSAIEEEYGFFTTRIFRVFRPKAIAAPSWRWRRVCCIPTCVIFVAVYGCIVATIILLLLYRFHEHYSQSEFIKPALITMAVILGILFLSSFYTWIKMVVTLIVSHRHRIDYNLRHFHSSTKSHFEALKSEVEVLASMVKCIDAYVGQQTRFVVVVDGLDSCEQERVLHVLDAVHLLFSDPNAPFVTVLAIDPHVIIKAIEANINRVFHNSTISGQDYLRNIVHLPFYLQNSGLRRVKSAQQASAQSHKRVAGGYWNEEKECDRALSTVPSVRKSSISSTSVPDVFRKGRKGNPKLKASESIASSIGNLHRTVTGAQDLTRVLLTDDYFSDVNPRSMRRLMNIVYVAGRLLKAFNIDFNWYHLASWINITEQWPIRTSQMILYYEAHESEMDDSLPLKAVFERVKRFSAGTRQIETIGELDNDERKLEVFLSLHSGTLLLNDMKVFLPFTINLDPYIRKSIQEEIFRTKPAGDVLKDASKWLDQNTSNSLLNYNREIAVPYGNVSDRKIRDHGAIEYFHVDYMKESKALAAVISQKLSSLTVEGVINLLTTLEGVDSGKLQQYSDLLRMNNINGRVLLTCDINELKNVVKMTFGDWEQFRILILTLRDQEFRSLTLPENPPRYIKFPSQSDLTHHEHAAEDKKAKEDWPVASEERNSHLGRTTSALEKQVTMEDTLIVGALETLNEDALEDAFEERCLKPESAHSGLPSNLLSPILSDPEEQCLDDAEGIEENEVDVLYLQGPDNAPLVRRQSMDEKWENDNLSLVEGIDLSSTVAHSFVSIPEIKLPSADSPSPTDSVIPITVASCGNLPSTNVSKTCESWSSLPSPVTSSAVVANDSLANIASPSKIASFADEERTPLVMPSHAKTFDSRRSLKNMTAKTTEEIRRPYLERQISIDNHTVPITEALISPPSLKSSRKYPFLHTRFENDLSTSDSEQPLCSLKSSSETIL